MRKVIAHKNLPMRSPFVPSLVFWLVLERLAAPGWVWGVVGTIMGLIWIAFFVTFYLYEEVEVIK